VCCTHPHTLWSILRRVLFAVTPFVASQVHYTRPDADWSVSGTLGSPSRCLDHLRRVVLAFTLSYAFQTRLTRHHTVLRIPDAFDSPSHHIKRSRRVLFTLSPSRGSQERHTRPHAVSRLSGASYSSSRRLDHLRHVVLTAMLSGVSQRRCTRLQTVWCPHTRLTRLHAVSKGFGSRSRHLERFRHVWYASGVSHSTPCGFFIHVWHAPSRHAVWSRFLLYTGKHTG
jgi:hypothetical protein